MCEAGRQVKHANCGGACGGEDRPKGRMDRDWGLQVREHAGAGRQVHGEDGEQG